MRGNEGDIPRFLLLFGMLAPIMMLGIIILVGEITPGYDPISNTISQMGTPDSPYAIILNGGYFLYGLLIIAAAYGLYQTLALTNIAGRVAALLSLHALFTVLLGVFPDSLNVMSKPFTADILHNTISALSYIPLLVGILVFRRIAKQDRTLKAAGILGLVIVTMALSMPSVTLFGPFKPVSGLLQRILSGSALSWLAVTFFLLYRKRKRLYSPVVVPRS